MKKKYVVSVVVGLVGILIVGFIVQMRSTDTAEAIVYETEVSDASECTSYETFDAENSVCYFECADEQECAEIEEAVNAEYEELLNALESDSSEFRENEPAEDTEFSARYEVVSGENITHTEGEDRNEFRELWSQVALLSPNSLSDSYIEEFVLYEDASDDTLAFVVDDDADGKWQYGINFATHTESTKAEQTATLIHELAHIITLNESQVVPGVAECMTYQTDEGCATETSYLFNFVDRFWQEKEQNYDPEKFATEYAATNPEEDLAESFAFFVLSPQSNGTAVKDEKLRFFNSFTTLVDIRNDMRSVVSRTVVRERQAN